MRGYIGQVYDAATSLNYLGARYENSSIGRFTSEDPVFLSNPSQNIQNPQQLNSYSYSIDNPVTLSDPTGKGIDEDLVTIPAEIAIEEGPNIVKTATPYIIGAISAGLNYVGQAINNVQNGLPSPYTSNINLENVGFSGLTGGFSSALRVEGAGASGAVAATESLIEDPSHPKKAILAGITTTVATLGFGALAGSEVQGVSTPIQAMQYGVAKEVFVGGATTAAEVNVKSGNTSTSVAGSGTTAQNELYTQIEEQIAQIQAEINNLRK